VTRVYRGAVRAKFYGAVAALLIAIGVPVGAVDGTNFGSNTTSGGTSGHPCDTTTASQCVANNAYHSVYDFNLGSAWTTAVADAIGKYNAMAPIQVVWDGDSDADVLAIEGSYGLNGLWGWTYCSSTAAEGGVDPDAWCRPQWMSLNLSYSQTASEKRAIACHELGHTLGLRHSNESTGSCMIKNQRVIDDPSSHDAVKIDQQY
jgi:predicted Zn-dependent protease